MRITLFIAAFLLGSTTTQAQSVHKCTDAAGKSSFSDRPCEDNSARKLTIPKTAEVKLTTVTSSAPLNSTAPADLVAAYSNCQAAVRARSLDQYAGCLSSKRADSVRQAKTMAPSILEGVALMTPSKPTFVDGSTNRNDGRGTLRLTGSVDGKMRHGVIEFVLENGVWKLDQQAWSDKAFESAIQARAEIKSINDQQTTKACADAKTETAGQKTQLLDLLAGETLVAKLKLMAGTSAPFEYASPTEQSVMFRANATASLRCKYGNDYPISICYGAEQCLGSWFAGRKFPSQNGRIRGTVKNTGTDPIDVIVVIGKPF